MITLGNMIRLKVINIVVQGGVLVLSKQVQRGNILGRVVNKTMPETSPVNSIKYKSVTSYVIFI
jgi:hypothetical protein